MHDSSYIQQTLRVQLTLRHKLTYVFKLILYNVPFSEEDFKGCGRGLGGEGRLRHWKVPRNRLFSRHLTSADTHGISFRAKFVNELRNYYFQPLLCKLITFTFVSPCSRTSFTVPTGVSGVLNRHVMFWVSANF